MRYELILWLMWIVKKVPGKIGCYIRRSILPSELGKNVMLWDNVQIDYPRRLRVGDNTSINRGTTLHCGGGIEIERDVLIGPNVIIYSQNHAYKQKDKLILEQGYVRKPVKIEIDVWVGANATILPGVTLAQGCVIGASSIVTKSTEPYGIYVGCPAKKIDSRA